MVVDVTNSGPALYKTTRHIVWSIKRMLSGKSIW